MKDNNFEKLSIFDKDIIQIPSDSNIMLHTEGTFSKTKVGLQNFGQVRTS